MMTWLPCPDCSRERVRGGPPLRPNCKTCGGRGRIDASPLRESGHPVERSGAPVVDKAPGRDASQEEPE